MFILFSFPKLTGKHLLNIGIRSRFLTLKGNIPFIFAVDQLSYILEKEEVKTIIKIEDHDNKILPRLKNISRLSERVILLNQKYDIAHFWRVAMVKLSHTINN
jgi:hypothetical protein